MAQGGGGRRWRRGWWSAWIPLCSKLVWCFLLSSTSALYVEAIDDRGILSDDEGYNAVQRCLAAHRCTASLEIGSCCDQSKQKGNGSLCFLTSCHYIIKRRYNTGIPMELSVASGSVPAEGQGCMSSPLGCIPIPGSLIARPQRFPLHHPSPLSSLSLPPGARQLPDQDGGAAAPTAVAARAPPG